VVRPAVETTRFDVKAELACDAHAVEEGRERFPNKFFACVRPVHFGGIEKRHALSVRRDPTCR
jgi:hypothetical protein